MTELSIVVRATILLTLGLAAVRLARHASASTRHLILASMFGALLVLPEAGLLLPRVSVAVPVWPRGPAASSYTVGSASQPDARGSGSGAHRTQGHATDTGIERQASADHSTASTTTASRPFADYGILILVLWGAGMALFLLPVAAALVRVRGVRRQSTPWLDGEPLARKLAHEAGVHRDILMLVHDDVVSPTTFGLKQPVILMPGNVRVWPPEHVRHAVLHELEHVRRKDWAVVLGARVVCAVYWFHPLVWVARRRLVLESELACDDAVVRTAYADLLVSLAERMTSPVPQTTLAMAARGDLSTRVAAALDERRRRGFARAPLVAGVAATASCAALVLATLAPRLEAQASVNRAPAFTNVSVKASRPPVVPMWQRLLLPPPLGFNALNVSVGNLVRDAYDVSPSQTLGPDWIETEPFDITASDGGNESREELRLMIRELLADRFKLVVHTEHRPLPAYALVRSSMYAGLGPKLWRPGADCSAEPRPNLHEWLKQVALGQPDCGDVKLGRFYVAGRGIPLSKFAVALETVGGVDRPIIDQTGLTGNFDLELTWTPQQDQLFELIQQELGLALEPVNAPVSVLVVDRAERPSLN